VKGNGNPHPRPLSQWERGERQRLGRMGPQRSLTHCKAVGTRAPPEGVVVGRLGVQTSSG